MRVFILVVLLLVCGCAKTPDSYYVREADGSSRGKILHVCATKREAVILADVQLDENTWQYAIKQADSIPEVWIEEHFK